MIDFHSHILPGIDDGARHSCDSLEMLARSLASGVHTVVATPHCYLDRVSPAHFLERRSRSMARLLAVAEDSGAELPEIIPAAEVYLMRGVSRLDDLSSLCIGKTDYILIELPISDWTEEIFEELYHIINRGFRPVIAHLDRYFSQEERFGELLSLDLLFQINAGAFFDRTKRRKIAGLFARDAAHVVGSDMHNLTTRPPELAEAYAVIQKKFGHDYAEFLNGNAKRILSGRDVPAAQLPQLSAMQKMML